MKSREQREQDKRRWEAKCGDMRDELYEWRERHPEASFDEIANQVTPRRQELMGELLAELACQHGQGEEVEGLACEECGQPLVYKGKPQRGVEHLEGETKLRRAYYHCPHCKGGIFPLDRRLKLVKHSWSPETIAQAVQLGIQIPSYPRAATSFERLTRMAISKSSLQKLVCEYGERLVDIQAQEADAMLTVPADVEEGEAWRAIPEPDSEKMAVAMDGAMVNIRGEGWKEVKIVAVSAVETRGGDGEEPVVDLNRTSYRAGLWDAARFANQQWAEGCRRGLEKAKRVVCVNDGAPWIWLIVAMCYAPRCIEILDWWHAVEKLWELAFTLLGQDNKQSQDWAQEQKSLLWVGNLRQIFRGLRLLCPRGEPLPDKIRLGIGYLFRHRWRMRYREFRKAGCPIGSGSVESACKVVMQERMKQAGMRWSRAGAQAMLALRSVLLSERWQEVWPSLEPPPKLA